MQARFLVCFAGLAAGLFSFFSWTSPAPAQAVYTWSAGASGPWDTSDDSWGGEGSNTLWDGVNGPSNVADFTTAGAVATVSSDASVYANGIIFDSPATIGGAALTLATQAGSTYATPTITVNGSGGTIASALAGSAGLATGGPGVLTLSGYNNYSGGATVTSGTLALAAGGYQGAINGSLTVNPGAFVSLQAQDALGYGNNSVSVTTVNLNGSVLDNATSSNNSYITNYVLNGGTMSSSGGGSYNFSTGYGITTLASTATSVISSGIAIRDQNNLDFSVASGTTASGIDLLVSGPISEPYPWTASNGIIKDGSGVMYAAQVNYFGNTTVNGGTLVLGQFPATYAWNFPSSPEGTTFSVAAGAALNFQISDSEYPLWLNTLFTGGGTLTKSGSGSVTLGSYGGAVVNTFAMSPAR